MKTTINLQDELIAENRKALAADQAVLAQQAALDAETDKLVNAALDRATADYESAKQKTLETLGFSYKLAEAKQVREKQSKWAHLPQERIFTKDAIKTLCLKYNLRFLHTSLYKGSLDSQLPEKIEELRKANGGSLPGEGEMECVHSMKLKTGEWTRIERPSTAQFRIAAPAESFALQPRPIDPLLFCRLGDDQFYLVHKWGSDISWSRRWLKHWRTAVRVGFQVSLIMGFTLLGSQFGLLDPKAPTFLTLAGMFMGAFLGCFLSFGPPELFDSITRNDKTSNARNWDSPYTS